MRFFDINYKNPKFIRLFYKFLKSVYIFAYKIVNIKESHKATKRDIRDLRNLREKREI
jgi:hypothetical protein